MPVNEKLLYGMIGQRIRQARERLNPKMSQAKLAEKLTLSRASIVNIEAGRQHPPLHLLWQIAEELDTQVTDLFPPRAELYAASEPVKLSPEIAAQIEEFAKGDQVTKRRLSEFINRVLPQSDNQ